MGGHTQVSVATKVILHARVSITPFTFMFIRSQINSTYKAIGNFIFFWGGGGGGGGGKRNIHCDRGDLRIDKYIPSDRIYLDLRCKYEY